MIYFVAVSVAGQSAKLQECANWAEAVESLMSAAQRALKVPQSAEIEIFRAASRRHKKHSLRRVVIKPAAIPLLPPEP